MRKVFAMALAVMMALPLAAAQARELRPGVFVERDAASATGYTVTFAFEDAQAASVQVDVGANMYKAGEPLGAVPPTKYSPYEWEDGMIPQGYEGYIADLARAEGTNLWTVSMPLPCGLIQYSYVVDGAPADDPANPPAFNPNPDGGKDGDSTVFVPMDREKQPNGTDFGYLDKATVTRPGTLTYVSYTDVNGNSAPLGVYLPYGYDEKRAEPYKVVYVSHGYGASEVNWYGCGGLNVEYDHLIEDGAVEPTVVVTMNHSNYEWDFPVIIDNLMNRILPYMQERYNVSDAPSGRAFCGLSMGGMTTSNVLHACPDAFDYFGIFSGADTKLDFSAVRFEGEQPSIMLGAGCYDFGYTGAQVGTAADGFSNATMGLKLGQCGIRFGWEIVNGGHDWYAWPELMRIFAAEYLWK